MDLARYLGLLSVLAPTLSAAPQEPAAAVTAERGKLGIDLLLEWESVSSPRLSPDGKQIVFTRGWTDKINDRRRSSLWIMNADGSALRQLCDGSQARWSPDGTRLCFVAEGQPKGSQIHVMWSASREVTQITRLTESPSNVRWSPDSTHVAFTMVVPEKQDLIKIKLPKRPKGAKWAEEPKIITRLAYRRDGRGYRPAGYRHHFVVDASGGTPHQVTSGDFDHGSFEWSADGKQLVYSGLRETDADWQVRESEVYTTDVTTGATAQLTKRAGPDGSPVPSPDGKWIAYSGYDKTDHTYNISDLYLMRADGSGSKLLIAMDRQIRGALWSLDSQWIYFTVSSEGRRNVFRAAVDGRLEQVTRGQHQFTASQVGRNGVVVGTHTTPLAPGDIAIAGDSGQVTRLTRVNDDLLARVDLGSVERISYSSVGGLKAQGWIVKPPDFDPTVKYPLILQIHGGPHGMYGERFSFERHNHAAAGYVVLYTNPRGSVGYGKKFGNAIDNAYPGQDYDDLMRGVDAVIAKGYIDERNLFVYGGSGGGVLTAWIVGKTDRFRAAVSMFPVINWISFVGTTDGPYWYTNFDKLPWEGIDEHWRRSPLRLVGNVVTPTLLITGELDLRTPMAQTEEYYQALKLRKVETAMIRVADEYHGAARRHSSNQLRRILYVRGWFEKYRVGKDTSASATEAAAGRGR